MTNVTTTNVHCYGKEKEGHKKGQAPSAQDEEDQEEIIEAPIV